MKIQDKTAIQSILSILEAHDKLNKECPEVIEVIENYLAHERYQIELAYKHGSRLGNTLTPTKYYYQIYNAGSYE